MTTKGKIIAIYGAVAVISAGIIAGGMWLRSGLRKPQEPSLTIESGKETQKEWFPVTRDFTAVNQAGETVRLSQLKGKVWLVAEFFAVCPHCAMRNGAELRVIYDEFKDHPDFQMVCISVDPQTDTVEKLKDYASALGADNRNWWFLNGGDEMKDGKAVEAVGLEQRRVRFDELGRQRFARVQRGKHDVDEVQHRGAKGLRIVNR